MLWDCVRLYFSTDLYSSCQHIPFDETGQSSSKSLDRFLVDQTDGVQINFDRLQDWPFF